MKKLVTGISLLLFSFVALAQEGEKSVVVPNVFTPNQDGKNELFLVETTGVRSLKGRIYNRFGAMVYSWNSLNGGWDGYTYAGQKCPDGTYFYVITLVGDDDEISEEKGTVTLLR